MNCLVNSERGSAFIQVLVVAALVSVTALLTTSIASSMSDATARANFDDEVANEIQVVKVILGKADACTANLRAIEGAVPRNQTANNFRVNLVEVDRSGGAVTLSERPIVRSRHYRGATVYRSSDSTAVLRLDFKSPNKSIQERRREVVLDTRFDASGRVTSCSSQGGGEPLASDGSIVRGNISHVSGGCGGPPGGRGLGFGGFGSGTPSAAESRERAGADGKNAADKWKTYCRQQTFPLVKGSYQIYMDEAGNHQVKRLAEGQTGSGDSQILVLGPHANLFQCENDGLNPSGSVHRWRTGGGGGQDGSGSGYDEWTVVCVNGSWVKSLSAW